MAARANRKHTAAKPLDLAALLLGAGLFLYFLITVRYTEIDIDEAAYLSIGQRLMHGERLIADDWGLPQFSFLPVALPYMVYVKLTGSTDGVMLFARVFFVCTWALFYVYLYRRLRRFGAWGLAGAFLFCALVPQTIMSHSYFTISAMSAAAVGTAMLPGNRPESPARLILLGAAAAVGIMAEPALILLYAAWFILTVICELRRRGKKPFAEAYAFLLNKKTFLLFTAGAAAVFAALMAFLAAAGSLRALPQTLPYLLSDGDYNTKSFLNLTPFREALQYFGRWFSAAQALCIAVSLLLAARGRLTATRSAVLFSAACALTAASYIYAGVSSCAANDWAGIYHFLAYHNLPLLLFSPIPFILSKKRIPDVFSFWLAGLGYSLLVDLSSTTNLGSGGNIARIPLLLQTAAFLDELKTQAAATRGGKHITPPKNARPYRIGLRIGAVCAALVLLWNCGFIWVEGMEKGFTAVKSAPDGCDITAGPYRYMKMPANEAAIYRDILQDLDVIKTAGGRVCVPDDSCFLYLYLDLPYASYSVTVKRSDLKRLYEYWRLSDTHAPDWIYLPNYEFYSFERLDDDFQASFLEKLQTYIDCDITRGKAGYLIRVDHLRPPEETPG